ncbi:MAG: type II and III secretion system protein family protein [Nitrospirae bacterium]|nr:MAG: type II and III secretion system protein family protein [Nitrospirota bacterium]
MRHCVFFWTVSCMALALLGLDPPQTVALTQQITAMEAPQELELVVGKSIVLNSDRPIKRASLANPEIAEALVLSTTQVYVFAKTIGATTLIFWDKAGKVFAMYDLIVTPELSRLKAQIHELFPEETNIKVRGSHDYITLSGSVSGPDIVTQVVELAETYAPKKVKNLLQVSGVQQVMLEVRVAEMQRSLLKRLGVNFGIVRNDGNGFGVTTLNSLSTVVPLKSATLDSASGGADPFGFIFTPNFLFRVASGNMTWTGFIDALKQNNLTKVLAEPTLVALSGQEASFLAGGEFPIPVPQSFGVTTIKFKKFGVRLNFSPIVLSNGRISMKVAPEVSELDFSGGISVTGGITVPAITMRRAETVIELKDGQSFAIAGLIQDNVKEAINKYPVLGDIPILGALFRSSSFQKNETELVVIVTPRLVKPLDIKTQSLPTDSYLEPNDFEFMLMGYMEGAKKVISASNGQSKPRSESGNNEQLVAQESTPQLLPVPIEGGLEGPFGHLVP